MDCKVVSPSRINSMISHFLRTVKDEELMHPFIFAERDQWDIANNTPAGLMRRAEKLDPESFLLFEIGVLAD